MKRRTNIEATPDRVGITANVLHTPVNDNLPVWSQNLQAETPNLNAIPQAETPNLNTGVKCQGTPALLKSLGIIPELDDADIAWQSCMATPSTEIKVSTSFCTPEPIEDRSKSLQRRHLFQNLLDEEVTEGKNCTSGNAMTIPSNNISMKSHVEKDASLPLRKQSMKLDLKTSEEPYSVLNLLQKRAPNFIYPKPVLIEINNPTMKIHSNSGGYQKLAPAKLQHSSDEDSASSPVLSLRGRKKNKEIRKSLKFNSETGPSASNLESVSNAFHDHEKETNGTNKKNGNFIPLEFPPQAKGKIDVGVRNQTDPFKDALQSDFGCSNDLKSEGGFCTARGTHVSISKEALEKAKSLFEDDGDETTDLLKRNPAKNQSSFNSMEKKADSKEIEPDSTISGNFRGGFNTAAGKPVAVSKQALDRARNLFDEDLEHSKPVPKASTSFENPCAGFSTAGGRAVAVSKQALDRAKNLFENDLENLRTPFLCAGSDNPSFGFSTAGGKAVKVSKEALDRAKNLFNCDMEDSKLPNTSTNPGNPCLGFSTAGGKAVKVSKEALDRANALFENDQEEPTTILPKSTVTVKQQASRSAVHSAIKKSSESLIKNEADQLKKQKPTVPAAMGFSTARGNTISVSEKALARAQQLFEEETGDSKASHFSGDQNVESKAVEPCVITNSLNDEMETDEIPTQIESDDESQDRKRKIEDGDNSDEWASSPTIGKKKRKDSPFITSFNSELMMTQTQNSAFDCDPTSVFPEVLNSRRKARQQQKLLIPAKKKNTFKVAPKPGALYLSKGSSKGRKQDWIDFIGQKSLPQLCSSDQLLAKGVTASVCLVNSSNASSFNFYGWEYFSLDACRTNAHGFQLGEFLLIIADDNTIGCDEIADCFLASANVDPKLITLEWIKNHYRWIVWKLACMELRLPGHFAQQCLTPQNVLEQLKYRYDREIDRCERPALKRIIEQDDAAAKTMILCVSRIDPTTSNLELTDGWYSIPAHCDAALKQMITKGKISIGVKLVISGAELASPGPTSPLEIGADTFLKISANSTRRGRWNCRLGYYKKSTPFPVSLGSILPDGGLISYLRIMIIRVYPIIYMEKTPDGKTVFRGERYFRKVSERTASRYEQTMEKIIEEIEREEEAQERKRSQMTGYHGVNLTDEEKRSKIFAEAQKRIEKSPLNPKTMEFVPLLKLKIIDWRSCSSNTATLSLWRPTEDMQQCIRENQSFHLYNVTASNFRSGELQLNSLKHTRWEEIKDGRANGFERSVTSFQTACQPGFKPSFNELDAVGLVVFVAQPVNSFQTAVLSDGQNYLGIKCWSSFEDYALTDVIVTGTFLSFANLQWRSLSSRDTKLSFAFVHEGTVVSTRPAHKHLEAALNDLRGQITDRTAFIAEAETHVTGFLGNITPHSAPPRYGGMDERKGMHTPVCSTGGRRDTPTTTAPNPVINRAKLLEKYGTPPSLTPWNGIPSPHVRQKFKPPAKKS